MKVRLKALEGIHRGRDFRITLPQCIVGRGQECDLKPVSPAVSRQHCVILVKDGMVLVRDLQSRNGTFVNGQRIEGRRALESGDKLQFGPLAFKIVIDHSLGGDQKQKVKSVKQTAQRVVSRGSNGATVDENDVSDWLDEADRLERKRRLDFPETLVFQLEDTRVAALHNVARQRPESKSEERKGAAKQRSGKSPGKLPSRTDTIAKDSSQAAADALREFFGRR